ncbi:MAG TPA: bifunctional diaminohydroxyphosphoribosylaminopyrimidine deaminase/5-amino-6-(5-phosphoribosylamino)uracil reductase RibD [Sphingobacterium sp.]|jgi:diaminohydroxyphosphoribosylaminopyrimidine deaminase/5-amino-6-(5-phosphoribosylamino)uracil reductase|uniref:bifunctional diaminohydroxyphosphoribosylaminopyrimidine deaminase/5-amino-6-(5-phosphoribosylamino)uracil reductase RibD n=1 Tax=Sphingobacterium TaxID=28453 RepID=UPI0004E5F5A6|nr:MULTISPECIES: bifunctional diaminohydroxyphosphoribosylaminopyrimidine deaminase/5-amino-6-(5-phosphoribosylamino)uracil reductase RibD [Sphingobacterium]UXD67914.1 bifunctional diaminohydroxyphosphoribosylaminopyrimidine deaminase/5-amino-6-(5-phosphoribosylamino)uracil reductase RibD [Sphingobacterium faecium]CDS92350.1 Riboflavin biosynthesis protein RibD [Sphingobacterium sp. PM2-P1-29]HCU45160.1 bifunctional diaminohydroxyphosphoribosylaminopyrimidine deaminase/5-amino-6-(5-phosphoribosy
MNMQESYMRRCLELAILGAGTTSPNPMVGAVIVCEDQIIGEGYTSPYGGAHAEVNAIQQVLDHYGDDAAAKLRQSIFYVSLEPCAHFGKTPPCADLIAKYKPQKVYIACLDPFAQVDGKGVEILKNAGVEVEVGLLKQEALWLNRRFFTRVQKHRPYVILKWAESADGYLGKEGEQVWISNAASKQLVHKWRAEEDAILVGTKTALVDNPTLTVREWQGKNPKRILIDKLLTVPKEAAIFNDEAETIIFNAVKTEWSGHNKYIELENFDWYLPQNILYQLYLMDVQSIIIEGGAKTLALFIEANLWDEARVIKSTKNLGEGIKAPHLHGILKESVQISDDELKILLNM